MKHEWRKAEKDLYLPKKEPVKVIVPKFKYFAIKGEGSFYSEEFAQRIEVLNILSRGIKMMPKKGFYPGGYYDYIIYPIEAVWEENIKSLGEGKFTLMIRQPDFVTQSVARMVTTTTISTKPHPLINEVRFISIEEGECIQTLHTGLYEDRALSFERMDRFMEDKGILRKHIGYREIYLNDPIKTERDKLKTVLRYKIQ